ncbi:uncharacterized protein isoform X1 [Musca autumnalis]|uniref:uncharacterized protein isoform X1 n=1 Tax=Musca autumnalis TaxID=221902 RepID=UPI003CEBFFB9
MDLNKRTKVTTKKQFDTMVQILQNNPNLARGYSNGIKKISVKEEWNKISTKLNILGPPVRTGKGWMKVWADYKFKLRKKLVHNKAECRATGGGSFKQYILTDTEEAASSLLQLDTIVNAGNQSVGIQQPSTLRETTTEEELFEACIIHEDLENHDPCTVTPQSVSRSHAKEPQVVVNQDPRTITLVSIGITHGNEQQVQVNQDPCTLVTNTTHRNGFQQQQLSISHGKYV